MKKLMYFAAALLVLVGCNKNDNIVENAPEGTPFEKGQKVTLTIGTGAQQGPNKVAGVDNTTDGKIDFAWEEGDKILVKVGDKTAEFTLTTGAGSADGEFTGTMPAAGSTFDIQYPTALDLTAQVYTSTEPIPADKMLFKKKGCTLGESATLSAQYAIVQLNLYGTSKTIGKIVFTNTTASPTVSYTLTCTDGVTIGTDAANATPFYIIVPEGEYKFEVEVYDNATTPAEICSFVTSAAQTLTAGKCLNMSAKEVKDPYNGHDYVDLGLPSGLKWATMNVGATAPEGYGDYFAWGETAPHQDNNYSSSKYTYTDNPATLPLNHDAANVKWGGNWRMPTIVELAELSNENNCEWVWQENYNSTGVKGCLVTSKKNGNSIFLPASGCRDGWSLNKVGSGGDYWTSSLYPYDSSYACGLYFNFSSSSVGYGYDGFDRYYGYSVRPVCQ